MILDLLGTLMAFVYTVCAIGALIIARRKTAEQIRHAITWQKVGVAAALLGAATNTLEAATTDDSWFWAAWWLCIAAAAAVVVHLHGADLARRERRDG